MGTYDLCLYGHLTIDRIFTDLNESVTLGALANVWDALTKIDPTIKVKLNPISLGEAIILVDHKNSYRIGRGNLNIKEKKPSSVASKWHHIMYLNQLNELEFIDEIKSGVISADISTSQNFDKIYPFLNKIDFLFISDEDLIVDIKELSEKVKGRVILHYPAGSTVTDGKEVLKTETEVVSNVNVLGAGDIFAASFISSYIKTNDLKKSIEFSHQTTIKLLMEKK